MTAVRFSRSNLRDEVESLDLNEIRSFAELLKATVLCTQPIYVGMTFEQTLHARFNQHRQNYNSTGNTGTFGERLRNLNIAWDDVIFACSNLATVITDRKVISLVEKHLHSAAVPHLSLR